MDYDRHEWNKTETDDGPVESSSVKQEEDEPADVAMKDE